MLIDDSKAIATGMNLNSIKLPCVKLLTCYSKVTNKNTFHPPDTALFLKLSATAPQLVSYKYKEKQTRQSY